MEMVYPALLHRRVVVAGADKWERLKDWVKCGFELFIVLCLEEDNIKYDFPAAGIKGFYEGVNV